MALSEEKKQEHMKKLSSLFPDHSQAELSRFCRARPASAEEAADMFQNHLDWRKSAGRPQQLADAANLIPEKYVRVCDAGAGGNPVLLVQGARYDPGIDPEKYVLACAHAVDLALEPGDSRKLIVLIDVRPGANWFNVPAYQMLPFFRLASFTLSNNYPERAQQIIVFPVPMLLRQLWIMIRSFMDPATQDKFVVLAGSADIGSPCPTALREYVSLQQLPSDAQSGYNALAED
eukprot:TRINITY_DN13286_c0_g1_i1.p1 TRINITY_DN13286_c0_g1~~TRINITY_DN13286_c0_g1_i1.p1  ORF type:complete len:233 (+),score=40.14 TRINITY_DN13286_c0_g1_i1:115-813(+)